MNPGNLARLDARVVRAAEAALADHKYVTAIDVLTGIGWLPPASVDRWRQGRSRSLEAEVQAGLSKISTAMRLLRKWAERNGLHPSETVYVARTRDRRKLQFSVSGDPAIERAYRTHWVSPVLSELKRQRLAERQAQRPDLVVIQAINPWTCAACGETGALLIMEGDRPLCMTCAGLGDLVFLPAGAAAPAMLLADPGARNAEAAKTALKKVAEESENRGHASAYRAFLALSDEQQSALLGSVTVIAEENDITELSQDLQDLCSMAVRREHLEGLP